MASGVVAVVPNKILLERRSIFQSPSSSSSPLRTVPSFLSGSVFSGRAVGIATTIGKCSRRKGCSMASISASSSSTSGVLPSALLFDCDGVLVDTEKDGHRISFNDTFAEVLSLGRVIVMNLGFFIELRILGN